MGITRFLSSICFCAAKREDQFLVTVNGHERLTRDGILCAEADRLRRADEEYC